MRTFIFCIACLVAISSCGDEEKRIEMDMDIKPGEDTSDIVIPISSNTKTLPIPSLENLFKHRITSGVEFNKNWYKYPYNDTGVFVIYSLGKDQKDPDGMLTVHSVPEKQDEYVAGDSTQRFIRVWLEKKGIEIFPGLGVESDSSVLYRTLGLPEIMTDTMAVYTDLKRTIAVFKMRGGKITRLDYGRYSSEFFNRPVDAAMVRAIRNW